MNSQQVDDNHSGKRLNLPEPDPENITVLTRNLPNTPILPWHHYDSPWSEAQEENPDQSGMTEESGEGGEEILTETSDKIPAEISDRTEPVNLDGELSQTEITDDPQPVLTQSPDELETIELEEESESIDLVNSIPSFPTKPLEEITLKAGRMPISQEFLEISTEELEESQITQLKDESAEGNLENQVQLILTEELEESDTTQLNQEFTEVNLKDQVQAVQTELIEGVENCDSEDKSSGSETTPENELKQLG